MHFSWRAFLVGCLIHILTLPFAFFIAVMGPLAAFSPNYHTKGTPTGNRVSPLGYIWFGGTIFTKYILDHTIFDGPMPQPPSNGFTADMRAKDPELGKLWDHYTEERIKREKPYQLSWIASPLLIGLIFGFGYPLLRRKKAQQGAAANP